MAFVEYFVDYMVPNSEENILMSSLRDEIHNIKVEDTNVLFCSKNSILKKW